MSKKKDQPEEKPLHERLPPCVISPGGSTNELNQANLLMAKQNPAFPFAGGLLAHCLVKRGEKIMLDFTQQACNVRFQVDGFWHNVDPYDREMGDAMLTVLKKVANLNPADRRSRQESTFGADFKSKKYNVKIVTQGVPTGERVMLQFTDKKFKLDRLDAMGMREKMVQQFKEAINGDLGLTLISAPPENGLPTLWRSCLNAADRFIRDYVSVQDRNNKEEEEIINVNPNYFDSTAGETPATVLPKLLLRQPDSFVLPDFVDGPSLQAYCEQATTGGKPLIGRVQGKDCAEAIMRLLAYKANPETVAKALKLVVNQRLCRKLCEQCRQAYQPTPQLLQQLGIPAGRVQNLFKEWTPPPPEQCVDAKGRPIEIPICANCQGICYYGRTGIFEMWTVDDKLREVMVKAPTVENLRRAAAAGGNRSLQQEAVLLVAQGVTSLTELQRVMKL